MSFASYLDALAVYEAAATRVVPRDAVPEHALAAGGNLAAAFDREGRAPLARVMSDDRIEHVELHDGDLVVSATRTGADVRLAVLWNGKSVVDEALSLDGDAPMSPVGSAVTVLPEALGSAEFQARHGVRWSYLAGAMAGGIASSEMLIALARDGLMGFFGAGGLPLREVEKALKEVTEAVPNGTWGFNLLHNPVEPAVEEGTVDLYLKYGVRRVSASAYMGLSASIVRYRFTGIHRDDSGQVVCPNAVFAKVSRTEVAEKFLRPAPEKLLAELVASGGLTQDEATLAVGLPVAEDVTAEGDSGGHTDHRPTLVLVPALMALRDTISQEQGYAGMRCVPRIGAAGGIGTGAAAWALFAMGVDYILTGSINQASVEAGTSSIAKDMLLEAAFADVATGPAPDMFEMGAHVQVLSRGSMYAQRGQRLYDIYRRYGSMDEIPDKDKARIEKQLFRAPLEEIWEGTKAYWQGRDPKQVTRAERDGRHKMALTFRWYLGMTSRWARLGDDQRKRDFQVWCGPAMGGFNAWVAGTDLEPLKNRTVVAIADAIMQDAARRATETLQKY